MSTPNRITILLNSRAVLEQRIAELQTKLDLFKRALHILNREIAQVSDAEKREAAQ